MNAHPFGQVIQTFTYDFESEIVEIVKLHPWKDFSQHAHGVDDSRIEYHCASLGIYGHTLLGIVLAWILHHQLGDRQNLAVALMRMLKLEELPSES